VVVEFGVILELCGDDTVVLQHVPTSSSHHRCRRADHLLDPADKHEVTHH
jgi:hypothetical protein